MKLAKRVFLAIALAGVAATTVVNAQGYVTESTFPTFFAEMRPMIAKMPAADKKKAMEMEAGIMKKEGTPIPQELISQAPRSIDIDMTEPVQRHHSEGTAGE